MSGRRWRASKFVNIIDFIHTGYDLATIVHSLRQY